MLTLQHLLLFDTLCLMIAMATDTPGGLHLNQTTQDSYPDAVTPSAAKGLSSQILRSAQSWHCSSSI